MPYNRGYSYRHVLGRDAPGHSIGSYLARHFPHANESEWRVRVESGEVLLDDRIANGSEPLRAGNVLTWNRPGWVEEETPQNYDVIFQDKHLLVVNKPSGLPTLPGGGFYLNTLLSLVQTDFPDARPLHRLGRATSGLVLFAFDSQTAAMLSRRWPDVHKQYQALGSGVAAQDAYDIQTPIGPCSHPRLGHVHAACPTGKPARSLARVLQRRAATTVFEVDLLTGRPHQIRIHLASIGHPLAGDPLYATGGQPRLDDPGLPGDAGYWLHAKRVVLKHPLTGEPLDLRAPLPDLLQSH
jgi:23S rRNA pseudouridine1911/1915/1917 synthase